MSKKNLTKFICSVGLFSALSICLYLPQLRIGIPFFPPFLKLHFSMLPIIIGSYVLNPLGGILILVIKTIVYLPSSSTLYIGEMADFIIGLTVVLTTSLTYKKTKAIYSLIFGVLSWIGISILLNYFVLVPVYIKLFFKGSIESFVNVCSVIDGINENNYRWYFILYGVIPFNAFISIIVSIVTFLSFRKIEKIIKID